MNPVIINGILQGLKVVETSLVLSGITFFKDSSGRDANLGSFGFRLFQAIGLSVTGELSTSTKKELYITRIPTSVKDLEQLIHYQTDQAWQ